ncbi:MAG: putative Xylulokinase [Promethearchaeota archaeon]|nr:MAG: putative Xylulokinase [Candidatus Lokiarchaeota archaeon]
MTEYRMVFDCGSKIVKCAIADEMGTIIAIDSWTPEVIESPDGFQREWNYNTYWDDLLKLTKKTIDSAKINPKDIKYITSSSIRPSCVFADDESNAIYIGASFELRGIDYADELEDLCSDWMGKSMYQSCGHFPSLLLPPARYKYFQEETDVDDRISQITQYLPQDSWILVKFGGETHASIVSAAESGFLDLETKLWHPAWKNILDLPDYFFPWPVLPGEIIGTVSEKYQQQLGLSSETNLVAGIPDTQAALLGCNSITEGSIGAVLGTTTPVQMVTQDLHISSEESTWSGLMTIKNLSDNYYIEANTGLTGQLLIWAAKLFFSDQLGSLKERFEALDLAYKRFDEFERGASSEEIRMKSVFSFLGPSPLASTQMGITPGIFHFNSPGGVEELTMNKDCFIASVFDNIQFAISGNIDYLLERIKMEKYTLSIMGGITRNPILLQRFADLYSMPIRTSTSFETTIQGMLVLCDIAAEKIQSIADLKEKNQQTNTIKEIYPRSEMNQKLSVRYSEWQRLFKKYKE